MLKYINQEFAKTGSREEGAVIMRPSEEKKRREEENKNGLENLLTNSREGRIFVFIRDVIW